MLVDSIPEQAPRLHSGPLRGAAKRPPSWRQRARQDFAAFARHAKLDSDTRELAAWVVELAAADVLCAGQPPAWEQTRPSRLAARLARAGLTPLAEPFGLLWGFFQCLTITGRVDPPRGRYLAAYFQTLTELEDGLL